MGCDGSSGLIKCRPVCFRSNRSNSVLLAEVALFNGRELIPACVVACDAASCFATETELVGAFLQLHARHKATAIVTSAWIYFIFDHSKRPPLVLISRTFARDVTASKVGILSRENGQAQLQHAFSLREESSVRPDNKGLPRNQWVKWGRDV